LPTIITNASGRTSGTASGFMDSPSHLMNLTGREIAAGHARYGSPLRTLNELQAPLHVMHLFSMPKDEEFLTAQQDFARNHPWLSVHRLDGKTPFGLECLEVVSEDIEGFLTK
jgi:hypothetical protein